MLFSHCPLWASESCLCLWSPGAGMTGHTVCPQGDLKVTHHADNTLRSFCKWQKSINMKGDTHPLHHDTAILLTRCCQLGAQPCSQGLILRGVGWSARGPVSLFRNNCGFSCRCQK